MALDNLAEQGILNNRDTPAFRDY